MIDLLVCIASSLPLPLPPSRQPASKAFGSRQKNKTAGIKQPLLECRRLLSRTSLLHSIWVFTLSTDWNRLEYKQTRCCVDTRANPSFRPFRERFDFAPDLKTSRGVVMPLADWLRICYCFQSACVCFLPCIVAALRQTAPKIHLSLFVTVPLINSR